MRPAPARHRLLRALRREPVDATPVWIMRQAGRYLPEYRAVRERAGTFLELCRAPDLACEVTLQPLARFALDAAIVFSDILTVPAAMGMELDFVEGEGPRFAAPLRDVAAIERLGTPDPEAELRYVMDTVRMAHRELDGRVPLIGFAGSPWTLATYMVEGGAPGELRHVKSLLYGEPAALHRLLDHLARVLGAYLAAQAAAGAEALVIFDTFGGALGPREYPEFSLEPTRAVIRSLRASLAREVPVILFTRGASGHLEAMADSGCDALGIDWTIGLGAARARVGGRVALQGNLDPCALYAPAARLREEVRAVLTSYGPGAGHVFNLGHGIHPHVEPSQVAVLVDAVHELSAIRHASGS